MADGILERGGEALQVARVMRNGIEDKTSAKRLREILGILRDHHVNRHIEPADLVATIEDLGPTFVKAGQIMSSRRDLFPAKYCDALANLRTKARPMTFSQVEARLNDAYGGNWGPSPRSTPPPWGPLRSPRCTRRSSPTTRPSSP